MPTTLTYTVADINSQSHFLESLKFISAAATVTGGAIFFCDATSASFAITLPDATVYPERVITFKKTTAANVVTIQGGGGQTVDGTSKTLTAQYDCLTVVSDGANWYVIT